MYYADQAEILTVMLDLAVGLSGPLRVIRPAYSVTV